eukprot:5639797-Pleurochrysis_carterae.AAC.1
MRELLGAARGLTSQWLAVAVSREANVDADRLSHPARRGEVESDATAAGLRTRSATLPGRCWDALRRAMGVEAGGVEVARRRRRR